MTMTASPHKTAEPRSSVLAAGPAPSRPFGLLRHSLALTRRSLIKTLHTPEQLLDVTLQPIIFLLLFVYLLGGAITGDRHEYLQFLLPAIMVQTVLFGSVATGVSLNTDVKKGVFDRFRSLPIGRSAPLIGSVVGDLVRFVVCILVMFATGYIMGFRIGTNIWETIAACLVVMFFAFSMTWIFVLIGVVMREPGAVQGISFVALFPLTFGTNMLVGTTTLPGWLQSWVNVNPVATAMDMSRAMISGKGEVQGPLTEVLLWSVGILVVFAPLAVRAYRRRA